MTEERQPEPVAWLPLIVVLQIVIIVGIVFTYLQINGLPERTAGLVFIPGGADNSGQIYQLQTSVDTLSGKVDEVVRILQSSPTP